MYYLANYLIFWLLIETWKYLLAKLWWLIIVIDQPKISIKMQISRNMFHYVASTNFISWFVGIWSNRFYNTIINIREKKASNIVKLLIEKCKYIAYKDLLLLHLLLHWNLGMKKNISLLFDKEKCYPSDVSKVIDLSSSSFIVLIMTKTWLMLGLPSNKR